MRKLRVVAALTVIGLMIGTGAGSVVGSAGVGSAVKGVVSDDAQIRKSSIAALREKGPEGLRVLMEAYGEAVRVGIAEGRAMQREREAIDAVAAQRDAYASGLYWYTDWDAARAAAKASGRPILSLRLMGMLDSEFSCANSRFFRTALYANGEVSALLREKFVLHWKSVRPVPKITIDFGDGRKLERTITGNSIHYVLDAEGNVIDGLPGLYGPQAFKRRLEAAANVELAGRKMGVVGRETYLRNWHEAQARQELVDWSGDIDRVKAGDKQPAGGAVKAVGGFPAAAKAARLAVGKGFVERPLLAVATPDAGNLIVASGDETWRKIAALHTEEARLDDRSRGMMATKVAAGEAGLPAIIGNFESAMAEDTVRNEYLLHREIHGWLGSGKGMGLARDVGALNERVYAELFLTPSADPWLGLVPWDGYSALEGGGVCGVK